MSFVSHSRRFLRTFTSAGLQGPVVWLKGDPITVVGRGRLLAVFHHESSPLMDGTQKIGCTIYDGMTTREISSAPVAGITSGSMLSWVGFSSDLALAVMDDSGMLSMLMSMKPSRESGDNASFSWIPMIDTVGLRKSKEDSFWPVCVQNGKLLCVPLKGVLHPNPARRPITSALQLRIPLVKDGNNRR
jgi:chromosome transmission fidelity protein 4